MARNIGTDMGRDGATVTELRRPLNKVALHATTIGDLEQSAAI